MQVKHFYESNYGHYFKLLPIQRYGLTCDTWLWWSSWPTMAAKTLSFPPQASISSGSPSMGPLKTPCTALPRRFAHFLQRRGNNCTFPSKKAAGSLLLSSSSITSLHSFISFYPSYWVCTEWLGAACGQCRNLSETARAEVKFALTSNSLQRMDSRDELRLHDSSAVCQIDTTGRQSATCQCW